MNSASILLASLAWFHVCQASAAQALPSEAVAVIQQVRAASARKDLLALRALMSEEFTRSFGPGDARAEQALQDWKADPSRLAHLNRVTGMPCALKEGFVECPRNAGVGYRAGFRRTTAGWRMVYFVAGD